LESRGFRVIRFRNQALDENIWLVVAEIRRAVDELDLGAAPLPNPPRQGEGAGQSQAEAPARQREGTDRNQ
jgi:hypothetical protein